MNKFLFVFGFLLAFLFLINYGFASCSITSNILVCNISHSEQYNLDSLEFRTLSGVQINYLANNLSFVFTNTKYDPIDYNVDGNNKTNVSLDLNLNLNLIDQNLTINNFNGDINFIQKSELNTMYITESSAEVYNLGKLNELKSMNSSLVKINSLSDANINKISIYGDGKDDCLIQINIPNLVLNNSFNINNCTLKQISNTGTNMELKAIGSLNDALLITDTLVLTNYWLDLYNSSLYSENGSVEIQANGIPAKVYIRNISDNTLKYNYKIYSTDTKTNIIDINNIFADVNFYFSPITFGSGTPYVVSAQNVKSNSMANFVFNTNYAHPSVVKNLLNIDHSKNVTIYGPEFDDANYRSASDKLFNIGADVNNLTITGFKYYALSSTKGYGNPISTASPIILNNSIINNANYAIYLNYSTISNTTKPVLINNSSFSNNNGIIWASQFKDNNVYFFNNFLKENTAVLTDSGKTKLLLLPSLKDTNNSFGPNVMCNQYFTDDQISLGLLSLNYKTIPISYYDSVTTNMINTSYSPICYGGNLYYEKQKALGCTSNCFEDGTDGDMIAEVGSTGLPTPYNGFDFAPLASGSYILDWNIPLGSTTFDDYIATIQFGINSECSNKFGGTIKYQCMNCGSTKPSEWDYYTGIYMSGSNPIYKYIPWDYKVRYSCSKWVTNKTDYYMDYNFNINVQNLAVSFKNLSDNNSLSLIYTQHPVFANNGSWAGDLNIKKSNDTIISHVWANISGGTGIYAKVGDKKGAISTMQNTPLDINSNGTSYFIGPFYIYKNATDTIPVYTITVLPVIVSTIDGIDLTTSLSKEEYDFTKDLNLQTNIGMINKSTIDYIFDLNMIFLDSNNSIFYSELYSAKIVKNNTGHISYVWRFDKLNLSTPGTYTFKVIETKSGLTAEKTFTVIDSSIKIKTVKTPDNSIYVIAMLVAVTIGFLVFKNRN